MAWLAMVNGPVFVVVGVAVAAAAVAMPNSAISVGSTYLALKSVDGKYIAVIFNSTKLLP